jgi:Domain of unknown function (DUF5666)
LTDHSSIGQAGKVSLEDQIMKSRLFAVLLLSTSLCFALAQDPAPALQNSGSWQGHRESRGAWGNGMGFGRGVMGTVTEVAANQFTIKTDAGENYIVHFSPNTRIMKQMERRRGNRADNSENTDNALGDSGNTQPSQPQMLKPADIKVGDVIAANGEVDAAQKSIGAVFIVQIDPERAKEMRAMEENYGKTWLMGRVTEIHEVTVTLQGGPGNATHTFTADENTTFRRRREPITLADVQVGDMVRVEGSLKDGNFVASTVAVMGRPPEGATSGAGGGQAPPTPAPQ